MEKSLAILKTMIQQVTKRKSANRVTHSHDRVNGRTPWRWLNGLRENAIREMTNQSTSNLFFAWAF